MTYPIWEQSLQNPEISIFETCGVITAVSTNRRRLATGGWTIEAGKQDIRFSLDSLDVLDFVTFLAEQGYYEVGGGVRTRLYRKAAK